MAARGGTRTLKLLVFWCDCCWSARNNQECKQHKTIVRKPRHVPRRRSWTCWYWQQRKGHRCKSARPSPVSHGVPIRGAGLPHDGRMLQDDCGDSGVCRTETHQRERPARLPLKLMPSSTRSAFASSLTARPLSHLCYCTERLESAPGTRKQTYRRCVGRDYLLLRSRTSNRLAQ